MMKTSIFTIIFKERPLEEALRLAKEMGYDGIEIWGKEPHLSADTSLARAKDIRRMLDYYRLEVPAIGSYIGNFSMASDEECKKSMIELEKYLNLMDTLKCEMIRVGCGGPNAFLAEDYHYNKALYWISQCAILAKQYAKKLILEIHNNSLIETIESAENFLKVLNHENVGLIHDAGNMYISDTDYGVKSIDVLGDYIFHVHVKDVLRVNDDNLSDTYHSRTIYGDEIFQHKHLGQGAVDHIPMFKALMKKGYSGFISCECHNSTPDIDRAGIELNEINRQIKIAVKEISKELVIS
jgi:L-ribulose-5-phosphate 3-epimerase